MVGCDEVRRERSEAAENGRIAIQRLRRSERREVKIYLCVCVRGRTITRLVSGMMRGASVRKTESLELSGLGTEYGRAIKMEMIHAIRLSRLLCLMEQFEIVESGFEFSELRSGEKMERECVANAVIYVRDIYRVKSFQDKAGADVSTAV